MRHFVAILMISFLLIGSATDVKRDTEGFPKYYYKLSDRDITENVSHEGDGHYYKFINSKSDTVEVYIQGVVKNKVPPNYEKASEVDLVVWCFAEKYPHPNHVFSDASGRIVVGEQESGKVVIASESFLKKYNLWNSYNLHRLNNIE